MTNTQEILDALNYARAMQDRPELKAEHLTVKMVKQLRDEAAQHRDLSLEDTCIAWLCE